MTRRKPAGPSPVLQRIDAARAAATKRVVGVDLDGLGLVHEEKPTRDAFFGPVLSRIWCLLTGHG